VTVLAILKAAQPFDSGSLVPGGLAGWIVGHLVLEEDIRTVIAVPDDLIFLVVLDEEAVCRDVVAIDDQTSIRCVDGPAHAVAMISTPGPDIVEDNIVAIDDQADSRATGGSPTDTEEVILKRDGIGGTLVAMWVISVSTCQGVFRKILKTVSVKYRDNNRGYIGKIWGI
jgi:hypothetical protein